MLRIQLVLIDDEDSVRAVYEAQIRSLCQMCGIDLEVVSCQTLAEGEVHVRAALPQSRHEQATLEAGKDRLGQVIVLDGVMPDGDPNVLAALALSLGKHLVRATGTPHVIPHVLSGHGILYKPSAFLVLVNIITTAMRSALGM